MNEICDEQICDEIAQMVERKTVKLEALCSNPATGKFFCTILQHVKSEGVYKIPTKLTSNQISVYMA